VDGSNTDTIRVVLTVPEIVVEPFATLPISAVRSMSVVDKRLVVHGIASQSEEGFAYWSTDGTSTGTFELELGGRGPLGALATAETLILMSGNPFDKTTLWATNGSPQGTQVLRTFARVPHYDNSAFWPNVLAKVGDDVDFSVQAQLWRTDGTPEGTELVSDSVSPFGDHGNSFAYDIRGDLYFGGHEPETGFELWRSDGTEVGTVRLTDIAPGAASTDPKYMTELNGYIYFRSENEDQQQSLWRIPIDPLPGDADANGAVDFADFLLLSANFGRMDEDVAFADGDFDESGEIDFADFLLLSQNFGRSREDNL
jgi:ELWxxDGT repeat protein